MMCITGVYPPSMVLCSGSAFNGNYAENAFNFKNYKLNFAEVMVDGVSVPSQAMTPNYTNGDFSEAYWTLMCEEPRQGRCIEMKEYPNGYCIYIFRIFGRVEISFKNFIKGWSGC